MTGSESMKTPPKYTALDVDSKRKHIKKIAIMQSASIAVHQCWHTIIQFFLPGNYCSRLLQTDLIFVNMWIFTLSIFISSFKPRWKSSEVFITGLQFNNREHFGPEDIEGMVQDRVVIKSRSGKSLFNLSSPSRVILLEAARVYNMWILATHFRTPQDLQQWIIFALMKYLLLSHAHIFVLIYPPPFKDFHCEL